MSKSDRMVAVERVAPHMTEFHETVEQLDSIMRRIECELYGHRWDFDRPGGSSHERNFCWNCDALNTDGNITYTEKEI